MKKVNLLPLAFFAMLSCVACQQEPLIEDASFDDSPITTIDASVETVEDPEAPETKSTLDYSGLFTWESDDVISFWPSSGDVLPGDTPTCVKFKVAQGGSSTATFVGSGWALKRSSTYYASMPFNSSDKYNKVTLDYSGQSQAANDDDSHLGAYDYLHAYFTTPATGNSSITFERIGTIAKFVLTVPPTLASRTFKSLVLESEEQLFADKVYYDPSKSTVSLTKSNSKNWFEIKLNVSSGFQPQDCVLTIYAMMPQIAWSGKTITAILTDGNGLEFSGTFTPKSNQAANKKLKYSVSIIDPDIHLDEEIMSFEDSNVKNICVSHWDTNHDGELSFGEARSVTELPYNVFSENTQIVSFNEFKYFTGLATTGYDRYTDEGEYEYDGAFSYCTNLKSITLPSSLTSIGIAAFRGCRSLEEIVIPESVQSIGGVAFLGADNLSVYMESATPPALTKPSSSWDYGPEPYTFGYTYSSSVMIKAIYVPSEAAVSTYKAATWWSSFSSIIKCGLKPVTPTIPVPEMVDLGLPSGIKWASFNVGASKPEDYGGHYQWAGLEDVTSTSIYLDLSNCPYHTGPDYDRGWTKYIPSGYSSYWSGSGSPDNKTVLDPEDDVAHVKLGGKWRMPTKAEFEELYNNCTSEWTTLNGVKGRKFTSKKNGNCIFLPAAGYRLDGDLDDVGSNGDFWSSSLNSGNPICAYRFGFSTDGVSNGYSGRYYGLSVRPVSE